MHLFTNLFRAIFLRFFRYAQCLNNAVAHLSEGWREKPCPMCDTSVDSSHSLGYTWSVHTIKSQRFSGGICTSNRKSILRYMTRPSHGGHAIRVRCFQDRCGKLPARIRLPGAVARAEHHYLPQVISLDYKLTLSSPAGAHLPIRNHCEIHVCRQSMRGLDRCGTQRRRFFSPANRALLGSKIIP